MAAVIDVPYFLTFAAQSVGANGGKASPKVVVPQSLESFVVQGVVAVGTASAAQSRLFLMTFESSKTGMWGNAGALADLIAGDGRNPGYFLTEAALEGGDVITCHLDNPTANAYTFVRVTLIGRARKKA